MQYDPLQLLLPFRHQPHFDAHDFISASSNQEALAWLDTDWPDRRLALFGPAGCGKSHLLNIWAEREGACVISGPALIGLSDLSPRRAVALDDADMVLDETSLLHFINKSREDNLRLLFSSRAAPAHWPVKLADLSSRLRATTAVEIGPPDDDLLAALLVRLIADRQLAIPQSVQRWLLLRLPRSAAVLREAIARLDRESLVLGAAITRALAATVLSDLLVVDP